MTPSDPAMFGGPAPPRPPSRDRTIDVLRGLAIAMMVFGHLAIEVLVPPGAFYIEALGGSAPTIFLIVSGMMVAYGARYRGYGGSRYLARGALVVAMAVALDTLVWRIMPFTTVDILYLIGLAIPVTWLVTTRLPRALGWFLALTLLLITPFLQDLLGYTEYPTEIPLVGETPDVIRLEGVGPVRIEHQTSILQHWIVDGWFPIFPWLGFALLGGALAFVRWRSRDGSAEPTRTPFGWRNALLPAAVLLTAAFLLGWWDVDYELTLRRRWGGAFMPPRHDYLLGSTGITLLLAWLVDRASAARLWWPFALVGRHALFVYLIHFALVTAAHRVLPDRIGHPPFWALYAAVMVLLIALTYGWESLTTAIRHRHSRGVGHE